jgi:PadR family transcriptional regulator, regulatory protein AphA
VSLTHAILGILSYRSMTGYDLKTHSFDTTVAHFWPADQAQIYRTLDKMAEQGWVESQIEFQEDRPNRKVYTITDTGREELQRWLLTNQPLSPYREPFLIQLFFSNLLTNGQIIALLEAQVEAHQERLARYGQIRLPPLDQLMEIRGAALQRLTLELGIENEHAYLRWLQLAIDTVRRLPES